MARIRMTQAMRDRLLKLAADLVECPLQWRAVVVAYEKAAPLVRAAVEKKYPPKDMRILKKYDAAHIDDCIKLSLTAGGVDMFNFASGTGPLVGHPTYRGTIYATDGALTDAFLVWKKATEEEKAARSAIMTDYKSLVNSARFLEEVIEIWPEAAQLRPVAQSTALTTLTPQVVDRIKADIAARTGKAPKKSRV